MWNVRFSIINSFPQPTAFHPSLDYWKSLLAGFRILSVFEFFLCSAVQSSFPRKQNIWSLFSGQIPNLIEVVNLCILTCGTGLILSDFCVFLVLLSASWTPFPSTILGSTYSSIQLSCKACHFYPSNILGINLLYMSSLLLGLSSPLSPLPLTTHCLYMRSLCLLCSFHFTTARVRFLKQK